MADQSTALGVLIGGTFALAGTVIGGAISLWNARAERKERRWQHLRSRLEEAADLSSRSVEWIIAVGNCRTLDELRPLSFPAVSRRLYLLSTLYFPSLEAAATEYHNLLIGHYNLAADSLGSGVMTVGAELAKAGTYEEVSTKLRQARQRIDDAIAKEAKKYGRA